MKSPIRIHKNKCDEDATKKKWISFDTISPISIRDRRKCREKFQHSNVIKSYESNRRHMTLQKNTQKNPPKRPKKKLKSS